MGSACREQLSRAICGLHLCETKHRNSDFPDTGSAGPQPSGQQFGFPHSWPLWARQGTGIYKCHWNSNANYREVGLLAPLPHVLSLGHHFEPTANSTENIIKMPVAREEREKEKKVWTLATAPGVLCGGSLGSCDTFWAPEKAW